MAAPPVVGIDIGTQQIKVAELRIGKSGRLTATALGVAPTPLGVMQNNIITDPRLMGQTIRQLVRESGITAKRTVAGIAGGSAVVIRIIEVPRMTDAELKETMKWEIERHVPFAPNESVMDYQPLAAGPSSETNPNMEVLLAVAQQDVVTNLVDTIFNAGLDPVAIDIEPLASARALLDVADGQPINYAQRALVPSGLTGNPLDGTIAEETVAIVNIGASNTDISIYVNGQLAFPRSLPLAGDSFTRAIAEALGYAPDQAERVKRDYAAVQIDRMAQYTGNDYEEGGDAYGAPEFPDENNGLTTTPSGRLMTPSGRIETPSGRLQNPSQRLSFEDNLPLHNPFDTTPDAPADTEPSLTDDLDRTQPIPRSTLNLAKRPDLGTGGFGLGGGVPGQDFGFLGGDQENPETRNQVFEAIAPVLGELATELRRSLDYYRSRAQGRSVDRVLLTGGSASLGNLAPFLQHELQVPVMVAEPLSGMDVVTKNYDPDYLRSIAPVFSVALGLAAREAVFNANPAPKAAKAPKAPPEPKVKKAKAGAK